MSVASAAPPNARLGYATLIALGLLAMAVAGSTIGYISYNYVTREELRNPPPLDHHSDDHHGLLPAGLIYV